MLIRRVTQRYSVPEMIKMAAGWGARRLNAKHRRLPDFLIIGAQRCGTTSLYKYLIQHPQVESAFIKETHFFDRSYHRGIDWYRTFFPTTRPDKGSVTGEATPFYLFDPHVPGRVAEHLPEVKLILLLRNPVDRAYSHFHYESRIGKETLDFEKAVERELTHFDHDAAQAVRDPGFKSDVFSRFSYLARGRYLEQIRRWMEHFPRQQLLVLQSEEFYRDRADVLRTVHEFLGIEPIASADGRTYNAEEYAPMSEEVRLRLEDYFFPLNQQLTEFLGQEFDWLEKGTGR